MDRRAPWQGAPTFQSVENWCLRNLGDVVGAWKSFVPGAPRHQSDRRYSDPREGAFSHLSRATSCDLGEHGIPNLERRVAESPPLFVRALALCSMREDDGQDPAEWRVDDPEQRVAVCQAAYRLLANVRRLPGADDEGRIEPHVLSRWVREVRRRCGEHSRAGIGDRRIGELLSRARSEENGTWPCRSVCEVLETVASHDIAWGFELGVRKARGVVRRGLEEGGAQERELSARYRAWAERVVFDYPYVANILERIARDYDRDAEREDSDVLARKRLQH